MLVIGFAMCVPLIAKLTGTGIFMNMVGSKTSALQDGGNRHCQPISHWDSHCAMVVAISVVIGMGIMIESFRTTVQLWMQQAIQGDVYINTMENVSSTAETPLPFELVEQIKSLDGIAATKGLKTVFLATDYGTLETDVITPVEQCRTEYQLKTGNHLPAWESLKNGEAVLHLRTSLLQI